MKKLFFAFALCAVSAFAAYARAPHSSTSRFHSADEFGWQSGRRLSWNDFRGAVPSGRDVVAAETSCGIGFETNAVSRSTPVEFVVYNTFSTTRSWVRPDARTPEVLEHEQGHFDLCELYTRKLRERFDALGGITVNNLKRITRAVWNDVHGEYRDAQEQYERETEHGLNRNAQKRWTAILEEKLSTTEHWASN